MLSIKKHDFNFICVEVGIAMTMTCIIMKFIHLLDWSWYKTFSPLVIFSLFEIMLWVIVSLSFAIKDRYLKNRRK